MWQGGWVPSRSQSTQRAALRWPNVAALAIEHGKRSPCRMVEHVRDELIPHAELLQSVARRIVDRRVLHLIKLLAAF